MHDSWELVEVRFAMWPLIRPLVGVCIVRSLSGICSGRQGPLPSASIVPAAMVARAEMTVEHSQVIVFGENMIRKCPVGRTTARSSSRILERIGMPRTMRSARVSAQARLDAHAEVWKTEQQSAVIGRVGSMTRTGEKRGGTSNAGVDATAGSTEPLKLR